MRLAMGLGPIDVVEGQASTRWSFIGSPEAGCEDVGKHIVCAGTSWARVGGRRSGAAILANLLEVRHPHPSLSPHVRLLSSHHQSRSHWGRCDGRIRPAIVHGRHDGADERNRCGYGEAGPPRDGGMGGAGGGGTGGAPWHNLNMANFARIPGVLRPGVEERHLCSLTSRCVLCLVRHRSFYWSCAASRAAICVAV